MSEIKNKEKAHNVKIPLKARVRRTLKFRVRDSNTNEVIGFEQWNRQFGWTFYLLSEIDGNNNAKLRSGTIPDNIDRSFREQFTHKKDKNNTEIYEGDIVKGGSNWGNENVISYIEFRNNGFWVHAEDFGYEGEGLWGWDEMEVIGNIFENPELLDWVYLTTQA